MDRPQPPDAEVRPVRILVLDDEPTLRTLAGHALKRPGWNIETVEYGAAAIALCDARCREGRPFDLLVLDLRVNDGVGGEAVLDAVRAFQPGVPAIACSGSEPGRETGGSCTGGFADFIPKPYAIHTLRAAVERALSRAGIPGA